MVNWPLEQAETWWGVTIPNVTVTLSTYTYIGVAFQVTVDGWLYGLSHYWPVNHPARHAYCVNINNSDDYRVVDNFGGPPKTLPKWQNTWFRKRMALTAGTTYRAGMLQWIQYNRLTGGLTAPVTRGHITFLNSFQSTGINPIDVAPTTNSNQNGIDVLFLPS